MYLTLELRLSHLLRMTSSSLMFLSVDSMFTIARKAGVTKCFVCTSW